MSFVLGTRLRLRARVTDEDRSPVVPTAFTVHGYYYLVPGSRFDIDDVQVEGGLIVARFAPPRAGRLIVVVDVTAPVQVVRRYRRDVVVP